MVGCDHCEGTYPGFKVTPFFDAENLRNGSQQVEQRRFFTQKVMQKKLFGVMFATGPEVVNTSDDERNQIVIVVENYSAVTLL